MSDHRTTVAAYVTSFGTFILGWALDNPASFVAAACAIGTFVVNWYYTRRKFKLIESRVVPFPSIDSE